MKSLISISITLLWLNTLLLSQTPIAEIEGDIITTGITDKDGDTKIELSEGSPEDTIIFNFAGDEEFWIFRSPAQELIFSPSSFKTYLSPFTGFELNWNTRNTFFGGKAGINTKPSIYEITDFEYYTRGFDNTFFGHKTGTMNESGGQNSFFGALAGRSLVIGDHNVFIGSRSGEDQESGSENTFIGALSGSSGTQGSGNIYIGFEAGKKSEGSNQLIIENSSDTLTPLIYGEFDNDIVKINGNLKVTERTSDPEPETIYSNSTPIAYCYVFHTGILSTNYGVASVNKVGNGVYDITLDNSFQGVNPVVIVTPYSASSGKPYIATFSATYPNKIRVNTIEIGVGSTDLNFSVMVYGWEN